MTAYPHVLDEHATLERVLAGDSLARYGDGEFKLCAGSGIKSQTYHPQLQHRLIRVLEQSPGCLVGIPNIRSKTPKAGFWHKYLTASRWLVDRRYGSAFISRPDSAPWIDTPAYWDRLESLWRGRDVVLVRGSRKGLHDEDLASARSVREVLAPRQHAFAEYDRIREEIGRPSTRVLLCLGPTATVLAADLAARDVHAIDLGHVALFWRKHRRGEPMQLTKEDQAA